jgi:hypothetical protein
MPRVEPKSGTKKRKPASRSAKPKRLTAEQRETRRRRVRAGIQAAAAVVVAGGLLIGYSALASHVADEVAVPTQPSAGEGQTALWMEIALVDAGWMSSDLADEICRSVAQDIAVRPTSRMDPQVLRRAHDALTQSPWVREVRSVRRVGDRLLVDCIWRRPAAIIYRSTPTGGEALLVSDARDEAGRGAILLPRSYDAEAVQRVVDGNDATGLRVITGIETAPPDRPGEAWNSSALSAGLEMARLLHNRDEAADVTVIDVSGIVHPNRRNTRLADACPIVLRTKYATDLYWGRPPSGGDFLVEPRPDHKLASLAAVRRSAAQSGRYPPWVDLRLDRPEMAVP